MFSNTFFFGIVCLAILLLVVTGCAQEQDGRGRGDSQALTQLGEALFFEKALSTNQTISCATCHDPMYAFVDPRQFSVGQSGKKMSRNTPTVINRPAVGFEFWDGRALSLVDQVVHPLETPEEMGYSLAAACQRLDTMPKYPTLFDKAFGSREVSPQRLISAIAAYLQTLQTYEADYERGKALDSLPPAVLRGEHLFFGKARCSVCHTGRNFTDERFHNTGVAWKSARNDAGRGALTGRQEDMRAFKTPTLRELVRTAPYMHDGSLETLGEVLQHYIDGGAQTDPYLDLALQRLHLTKEEQTDLLAFLRALSDSRGPPFYSR